MLSVGHQVRDRAERYVRNQQEHHRRRTLQDEYRAMLTRYGIEFDEQAVLGRCPRLRWIWPTAKSALAGGGSKPCARPGSLPQAMVDMAYSQRRVA